VAAGVQHRAVGSYLQSPSVLLLTSRHNEIQGLSPGAHVLNCELTPDTHDPNGGHEFRLIGLTR
jgi:hypothetical protein